MYYNISYDIRQHKTRRLAVKLCKKAGLRRLQRSVFMGAAPAHLIADLEQQLLPLLDARHDRLFILPLDRAAYQRLRLSGSLADKEAIVPVKKVIFI